MITKAVVPQANELTVTDNIDVDYDFLDYGLPYPKAWQRRAELKRAPQ